jgi:hypothetical protein
VNRPLITFGTVAAILALVACGTGNGPTQVVEFPEDSGAPLHLSAPDSSVGNNDSGLSGDTGMVFQNDSGPVTGEDSGPAPSTDSGPCQDSAVEVDSGSVVDSGSTVDTGSPTDSGSGNHDSGSTHDSGSVHDSGSPHDSSVADTGSGGHSDCGNDQCEDKYEECECACNAQQCDNDDKQKCLDKCECELKLCKGEVTCCN